MDGKLEERILAGVLKPSVCGEGKAHVENEVGGEEKRREERREENMREEARRWKMGCTE